MERPGWIPLASGGASEIDLPNSSVNLFGRIIRNPQPDHRPPKERECAEMLAALLSLAPTVRAAVLSWWLGAAFPTDSLEELVFDIQTEGAVTGGKRDDLRIEATTEGHEEPAVLISVEVKVGSGFHDSRATGDAAETQERLEHQVTHYDRWLSSLEHKVRRGVVLAPTDRADQLPMGLISEWKCVTWGELGRLVAELLEGDLPSKERFLARHFTGFIQDYLGDITVERDELSFDDVALLRAMRRLGKDAENRVNRLVRPLKELLEEMRVGEGEFGSPGNLFSGHMRAVVTQQLVDVKTSPVLFAGIVLERGADVVVRVETRPTLEFKRSLERVAEDHLPALQELDSRWELPDEETWWDLEIRRPLETLLTEEDQAGAVQGFVRTAVGQLIKTGYLADLKSAFQEGR